MNTQKLELIISIIDKYLEYDYKKDVLTAVEAAELLDVWSSQRFIEQTWKTFTRYSKGWIYYTCLPT